jgi:hypothetical protein
MSSQWLVGRREQVVVGRFTSGGWSVQTEGKKAKRHQEQAGGIVHFFLGNNKAGCGILSPIMLLLLSDDFPLIFQNVLLKSKEIFKLCPD